MIFSERFR